MYCASEFNVSEEIVTTGMLFKGGTNSRYLLVLEHINN